MRKPFAVLALLALVASVLAGTAGTAHADKTFTFYGAGWGHGLGLSQYGAYGLAQKGWSRNGILNRFYAGASVAAMPSPPKNLRVGLIQGYVSTRVKAVEGPLNVKFGGVGLPNAATIPSGETWTVKICGIQYCVNRPDGTQAAKGGGTGTPLFLTYQAKGSTIFMYGTGHNYDKGWMEFNLYAPCAGCALDLRVINVVGPQGYLYGLGEVPSSWPDIALQAQSIAARTYAFYKVHTSGQNRAGCNCALYATTFDQVYIGADKANAVMGERWVAAVDATNNTVLLKGGAPIGAFYHSSSGGHTEHNENVWGGTPLDYLRGRCDPGDFTVANPNRTWTTSLSGATIGNLLAAYVSPDIGDATGFSNIQRGVSGRIISVTVKGTANSVTVSGSTLRRALALKETRIWINGDKNITGDIRSTYDGRMCAPGLPMSVSINVTGGRYQRFGVGRIYDRTGVRGAYWTHGPILDKYLKKGGPGGFLGMPKSGVVWTSGGVREIFDGGWIYYKAAADDTAHEVHGRILTVYLDRGGASGDLGFPVTDVINQGDGVSKSTFERGSITCPSGDGPCTVSLT